MLKFPQNYYKFVQNADFFLVYQLANLKWCTERRDWTVQKWRYVIWSNESRFTIFKNDGPGRVWRTPGTRFNINFGGGGLMMWGCFSGKE